MTPREVRSNLRAELLSRMHKERLEATLLELEHLVAERDDVDIAPEGGWVGNGKDTLCVFMGGQLVAALVIQNLPMLDPLVLRRDIAWPALVLEFARLRAEGILQAQGFDEYFVGVPAAFDGDWHKYLHSSSGTERLDQSEKLAFYRRPL